jgi:hypothetical protein
MLVIKETLNVILWWLNVSWKTGVGGRTSKFL